MSLIVFLDSGPLGAATNPRAKGDTLRCQEWILAQLAAGVRVVVPEVVDYESRRKLIQLNSTMALARLDAMVGPQGGLEYLALTTPHMRRAAELWAEARKQGHVTAGDESLDVDCILAAQALLFGQA